MDLASVVAALASVGVRVSGSAPNSSVQVDSSRACPPGLAGPEPSGTIHDLGQHFQFGAVVWCVLSLSVVLGSCAFWRCVLSCLAALCVFCCGVSLRGVVRRCALCRVRPGVSCCAFPVLSSLCGVAVGPCSPLVPCSPVLCPVVLYCRVVVWCPVLLLCLVCFLPLFGFSYLKNRCKVC